MEFLTRLLEVSNCVIIIVVELKMKCYVHSPRKCRPFTASSDVAMVMEQGVPRLNLLTAMLHKHGLRTTAANLSVLKTATNRLLKVLSTHCYPQNSYYRLAAIYCSLKPHTNYCSLAETLVPSHPKFRMALCIFLKFQAGVVTWLSDFCSAPKLPSAVWFAQCPCEYQSRLPLPVNAHSNQVVTFASPARTSLCTQISLIQELLKHASALHVVLLGYANGACRLGQKRDRKVN